MHLASRLGSVIIGTMLRLVALLLCASALLGLDGLPVDIELGGEALADDGYEAGEAVRMLVWLPALEGTAWSSQIGLGAAGTAPEDMAGARQSINEATWLLNMRQSVFTPERAQLATDIEFGGVPADDDIGREASVATMQFGVTATVPLNDEGFAVGVGQRVQPVNAISDQDARQATSVFFGEDRSTSRWQVIATWDWVEGTRETGVELRFRYELFNW